MDEFFRLDPLQSGTKGIIFIGNKILVYRRDDKTDHFPLKIDFPGGGSEPGESPFETYRREAFEEFGLQIAHSDVVYYRKYPSTLFPGKNVYFPVVRLSESAEKSILFGGEGVEWSLISPEDYLSHTDAIPFLKERTTDYLRTIMPSKNSKVF